MARIDPQQIASMKRIARQDRLIHINEGSFYYIIEI
jgi:hypothetical protein